MPNTSDCKPCSLGLYASTRTRPFGTISKAQFQIGFEHANLLQLPAVSDGGAKAEIFDVFLSYNSQDGAEVTEIARMLALEGIKTWLDSEQIKPGDPWQTVLGKQIERIKSVAVFVGNRGLGSWQNEEVQAFVSQAVRRGCVVIPVILGSATEAPELPWPLNNRHCVDFRQRNPDPIGQLIWGITNRRPQSTEPLVSGLQDKTGSSNPYPSERFYPPLNDAPPPDQAAQLNILRRRVNEYWIEGVLKHSLHNEVLLSLGKRQMHTAVDRPWTYRVEVFDALKSPPLDDRDLCTIYDDNGLLLILGEPGSGKTTTLLDLARTLLDRAEKDIKERVPIILNLSSWKRDQCLVAWMADQLSEKYRVPRKIAHAWIQNGYLLPFLDGLDELSSNLQPKCVNAINSFIENSQLAGLVVSCRLVEYQWLPKRLKLNAALCLEPLASEKVRNYIASAGPDLSALSDAIRTDSALQELAQTPLMLSMMSLAFHGTSAGELSLQKTYSFEERRRQILEVYVQQMFQRKETETYIFPKEKAIGWLSWLARNMRTSDSAFLIESLQPDWLSTASRKLVYATSFAISFALICFLSIVPLAFIPAFYELSLLSFPVTVLTCFLCCLSRSYTRNGLVSIGTTGSLAGIVGSLFYAPTVGLGVAFVAAFWAMMVSGLIGSPMHVVTVESVTLDWHKFWSKGLSKALSGLALGLVIAWRSGWDSRTFPIVLSSLVFVLTYGGLLDGITPKLRDDKTVPNQGIHLSANNALRTFCAVWLTGGLIFGFAFSLWENLQGMAFVGTVLGAFFLFIYGGLICGCILGGSAVLKHYVLRIILWISGYIPRNFVLFLEHSAKLILLRKVGGGYIFIHRLLLDYFADLPARREQ
jgi:hypothetical protein